MNNQYTYGRSFYPVPTNPNIWVVRDESNEGLKTANINFVEKVSYQPTILLLESIVKAREEIEDGTIRGRFSTAEELINSLREDE